MIQEKCSKCGYFPASNRKFDTIFCPFCFAFSPKDKEHFEEYCLEKVNFQDIETFRKNFLVRGMKQKEGMIKQSSSGKIMARAPFGYRNEKGFLVPDLNSREVEEIFLEFLNGDGNLTKLSNKHSLSINGLKKILKNYSYLGKIKFANQIHEGKHTPLISSTLFNHVQNKLENLKIK